MTSAGDLYPQDFYQPRNLIRIYFYSMEQLHTQSNSEFINFLLKRFLTTKLSKSEK